MSDEQEAWNELDCIMQFVKHAQLVCKGSSPFLDKAGNTVGHSYWASTCSTELNPVDIQWDPRVIQWLASPIDSKRICIWHRPIEQCNATIQHCVNGSIPVAELAIISALHNHPKNKLCLLKDIPKEYHTMRIALAAIKAGRDFKPLQYIRSDLLTSRLLELAVDFSNFYIEDIPRH